MSGCGRLEKMAPERGATYPFPAGYEDEADRQPLRDVVCSEGQADEQPRVLSAAEGDPDADALGERMERS